MIETLTTHQDLTEALATQLLDQALTAGATAAEVVLYEGDEFEALVRKGEVERLKDSGSRAAGLRVFLGARAASTSTSDLTPPGLERLIHGAVALARVTSEDPFVGLPNPATFGKLTGEVRIFSNDVNDLPAAERIALARRVDAACFAADPRITNSRGGSFDSGAGHKGLAKSRRFGRGFRRLHFL